MSVTITFEKKHFLMLGMIIALPFLFMVVLQIMAVPPSGQYHPLSELFADSNLDMQGMNITNTGTVKAIEYCDENGLNCGSLSSIGGGVEYIPNPSFSEPFDMSWKRTDVWCTWTNPGCEASNYIKREETDCHTGQCLKVCAGGNGYARIYQRFVGDTLPSNAKYLRFWRKIIKTGTNLPPANIKFDNEVIYGSSIEAAWGQVTVDLVALGIDEVVTDIEISIVASPGHAACIFVDDFELLDSAHNSI